MENEPLATDEGRVDSRTRTSLRPGHPTIGRTRIDCTLVNEDELLGIILANAVTER